MPVCLIEAPPGIGIAAKKKMVAQVTAAIDEAYHIGETLVFIQECAPENVAMNGRLLSEDPRIREIFRRLVPEPVRSPWSRCREPFSAAHDIAGAKRSLSS